MTRSPMGLPGIPGFSIFGYELSQVWLYLILVAFFVSLTYIVLHRIVISPFGRILKGIRENEIAALAMGKNINKYKIIVFIIGVFFAGVASRLYAHYITLIDPSSFTVLESIIILLMVVFGRMGSFSSSFVGAAILVILPEMLRFLGIPSSVTAPL